MEKSPVRSDAYFPEWKPALSKGGGGGANTYFQDVLNVIEWKAF